MRRGKDQLDDVKDNQMQTNEIADKASLKHIQLLVYHSVLKALCEGSQALDVELVLAELRQVLHISDEEHVNELIEMTSCQHK